MGVSDLVRMGEYTHLIVVRATAVPTVQPGRRKNLIVHG